MKHVRPASGNRARNPRVDRGEERLLGAIAADFARADTRYAHQEGRVRWHVDRDEFADPERVAVAVQLRQRLLESSPRGPLPVVSDEMRTTIGLLGYRMPIAGTEAGWVRKGSSPGDHRLLVRVTLADPANLPTGQADVWLTSNLPLGSDLDKIGPADFDTHVFVDENLGGNQKAAVFSLTPEILAAAA